MLPVYTRYLTPADYGLLEILEVTVEVLAIVTGMGILYGLAKFYYLYKEQRDRNELVSTLFILVIVIFLATAVVGILASSFISTLVFNSDKHAFLISIAFVNLFLQFLIYIPIAYIRTEQRPVFFVVVSSVKLALQLLFNIVMVVYLGMGVLGVLYSTMASSLVIGVWLVFYTFLRVRFSFSLNKAKQLIQFGWPFVFSGLGAFILTYSDRFFLNYYWDLSLIGIYSLAYKFGFLLMMFPVTPLMNIWMVQRFDLVAKEGYQKMFNQFLCWFFIVTLAVGLGVSLIVQDVLKIMSAPAFWDASKIVPIIIFAYFLQACTDFFNFGIFHSGKTIHMAYGTGLSAIVIVAMSFLLIPVYGVYGAAWATLISFAVRLVYIYRASQRLFRIDFELGRPISTTLIAIGIYAIYLASSNSFLMLRNIYWSISFNMLLMALFITLLLRLNIITAAEKKAVLSSIGSRLKVLGGIRGQSA